MSFAEYAEYFLLTLGISSFFAMGGVGSAVALVPIFDMMGLGFVAAKAIALFINTSTTVTASIMNLKRGVLDVRFAFPLVVSSMALSPVGAYSSKYIDVHIVKWIFLSFLVFSATMMLFAKKEAKFKYEKRWILYLIGSVVGFISGLLGIGGGALVMPLMILLGFDAKKMAIAVSFMIPFSTFSAFLSYISFVKIDWILLLVTSLAAILGGYIGNAVMHFKLNAKQIKKVIAVILYILAAKMGYSLI